MKNKKIVFRIIFIILIGFISFNVYKKYFKTENKSSSATTESIDTNVDTYNKDTKIDWENYTDKDYEINTSITITEEGIYNLTGNIEDGLIKINTSGNVKLNLNNVNISNSNGPALYIENADNVIINLIDGSINYLSDGITYSGYDSDVNGALYSTSDISFDGTGTLIIEGNYQDGIVSKDDLKINNGYYEITSVDDAVRGKDSIHILDGSFKINSGADGLKSTNDTDTTKGFVLIENGTFEIVAEGDGIQAETKALIEGGTFNITTGGGSSNSSDKDSWGYWNSSSSSNSAKGIKSIDNLVISNGTFNLNTSDDAIHSNNYVGITNGTFMISSGDDGIHADEEIIIDKGEINITKSYEGIEATKVTINNGTIKIVASDDGINIAGGNDSSAMNRPGANNFSSTNTTNILTINDGDIYVNASGDGIDINGIGYIKGGKIIVEGSTSDGNGILDYDNGLILTGGEIIGAGSSGMFQSLSSNSEVYYINIYFTSKLSADSNISIVDSNDKTIISYISSKTISAMIIGSESLKKNETYKVLINDQEYETFTIKNISTTIGNYSNRMEGSINPGRR